MTKHDDAVELDGLGRDELVELVRRLVDQVAVLNADVRKLNAENEQLRRRLGLDSTNSGMPPSTDTEAARGKRARKRVDNKKATGRKPGKQPGARGTTLMQVTDPDETFVHTPIECGGCGDSLSDAAVVKRKTGQVFDLPEITVRVTEHVVEARRCDCGYVTCADMPAQVRSWACWGPRVRAVCVYLVVAQHVPYGRAAEICSEMLNVTVSPATIVNIVDEVADKLFAVEATIKALLMAAGVVHFDETGARVHNGADSHHVHVASTGLLALLILHKNRGRQAMNDIAILPEYDGVACHDGYERYWDYKTCTHAKCGAHLVRNLTSVGEVVRYGKWANPLAGLLLEANRIAHETRDRGDTKIDPTVVHSIKTRYGQLIARGYRATPAPADGHKRTGYDKDAYNLVKRMDTRRHDVLRFVDNLNVPFTNNEAERDLRPTKLHQKISNLWRTLPQGQNWCRIRSYITTLRKNQQPVLTNLQAAIQGTPWTPTQAW